MKKRYAECSRFGFNGKENDKSFGNQIIQDYGFRLYNPAIGKFLSFDPLAPEYPWYTPYQFAGNKPINSIDLDGLEEFEIIFGYDANNRNKAKIELVDASGPLRFTMLRFGKLNKEGVRPELRKRIRRSSAVFSILRTWYTNTGLVQKEAEKFDRNGVITTNTYLVDSKNNTFGGVGSQIAGQTLSTTIEYPWPRGNNPTNIPTGSINSLTPGLLSNPIPQEGPIALVSAPKRQKITGTILGGAGVSVRSDGGAGPLIDPRSVSSSTQKEFLLGQLNSSLSALNARLAAVSGASGGISPNEVTNVNLYFELSGDQSSFQTSLIARLRTVYPNATVNGSVNPSAAKKSIMSFGLPYNKTTAINIGIKINYADK